MSSFDVSGLGFEQYSVTARLLAPSGELVERPIEIRVNPVTGRTSRIARSRLNEKEPGTETLPEPPPHVGQTDRCPFCRPQLTSRTPCLNPALSPESRLVYGDSVLFPNLYPYGSYSAVSLFDDRHFVEIGTASAASYANSLMNSRNYLALVLKHDPDAIYLAITQNHLPSAGGSLLHPHLQINADKIAANHFRFLERRSLEFHRETGRFLFSTLLEYEENDGRRYIGRIGGWNWVAAFAPEGFFEIWGILPQRTSLRRLTDRDWADLALGIINCQRFYRSLCRNGYNLGLLAIERAESCLEIRIALVVRSNYAPWVRNDYTGFEVMLGDMTTFVAPEETARLARPFFESD
jgi:UDPglucose--hexose-1-phosphate uridylyltransferase